MKIPFIIVFGHNASGKSTFSKKLLEVFKLNRVNGDIVRDLLIQSIDYYSDTNYSFFTEKADSLNRVTDAFRLTLIKELIDAEEPILIDGASVGRRTRTRYLDLVKENEKYETIIIEISLTEEELTKRLLDRDKQDSSHRWLQQYTEKKKEMYEPVIDSEVNHYIEYKQDNFDLVVNQLNGIISSLKRKT